jgi:two-component system chemotaxis response regulator CheY
MKILLVDDSGTMRRIQANILQSLGFNDIVQANDGTDGLKMYQMTAPALVITDWNMREMSGLDLVKAIRETDKATPIIMVTTEAEKTRVVEAVQAGVSDYLIKPFKPEQLEAKVRRHATETVGAA